MHYENNSAFKSICIQPSKLMFNQVYYPGDINDLQEIKDLKLFLSRFELWCYNKLTELNFCSRIKRKSIYTYLYTYKHNKRQKKLTED